jgi:hypothetical protein
MAEYSTPPLFLAPAKSLYINSWIAGLPPLPPTRTHLQQNCPLKCKRAKSVPMATTRRETSPGKRRRVDDDVMPGQSASVAPSSPSSHPLDLALHNTFTPRGSQIGSRTDRSSPPRSTSPLCETIRTLKVASPPILTTPYDSAPLPVNDALRGKIIDAMARLSPGQVDGWVPRCLKVRARAKYV